MRYLPFSDESLSKIQGEGFSGLERSLMEQCRRANALAAAVHQWFRVSRMDEEWDQVIKTLKAYRGEGPDEGEGRGGG